MAKLLNLGCGSRFHPAWTNVDLASSDPRVIAHDIRRGLPFDENTFDAVYHSHVLEHLDRGDARSLVAECLRVLRPGGVLRAVVPDLEGIVRNYVAALERAARGDAAARPDHDWMTIELIDQMVRTESGGQMGRWLKNPRLPNRAFVERRVGADLAGSAKPPSVASQKSPKRRRLRLGWGGARRWLRSIRRKLAQTAISVCEGRCAGPALDEALFRQTGEVHRWMYDRVSLAKLLEQAGFLQVAVVRAEQSRIAGFDEFELDVSGKVRKPDSLFVEALKP